MIRSMTPWACRQRLWSPRFALPVPPRPGEQLAAVGDRPHVRQEAVSRPPARRKPRGRPPSRSCASSASSADPPDDRHDRAIAVPQPAARKSASRRRRPRPGACRSPSRPAAGPMRRSAPVQGHRSRRQPLPAAAPPPPPPPATGRRSDVFDPSQNPNAPGAPRPLGSLQNEPPPLVMADPPVGAPGGRRAGGAARSVDDVRCARRRARRAAGVRTVAGAAVAQSQRHRRGRRGRAAVGHRRRTPTTSATAMCCARTTRWRKTPSRPS